jgi:hypothetical protein
MKLPRYLDGRLAGTDLPLSFDYFQRLFDGCR